MKNPIERIAASVVVIATIASMVGGYYVLQYRVNAQEKEAPLIWQEIKSIKEQKAADHELLVRIDERTESMKKTIEKITK